MVIANLLINSYEDLEPVAKKDTPTGSFILFLKKIFSILNICCKSELRDDEDCSISLSDPDVCCDFFLEKNHNKHLDPIMKYYSLHRLLIHFYNIYSELKIFSLKRE